jgi:hypothetical protein
LQRFFIVIIVTDDGDGKNLTFVITVSLTQHTTPVSPAMVFLSHLLALVLASTTTPALSQIVYDQYHNASPITGTWSTGSQAVLTGPVRRPSLFFFFPWFFIHFSVRALLIQPHKRSRTHQQRVYHIHLLKMDFMKSPGIGSSQTAHNQPA